MRVAVIADVHANWEALRELAPRLREAGRVLFLGDAVGYYCQVNEVCAWLRESGAICLRGNHDHYVVHGEPAGRVLPEAVRFGLDHARRVITAEHLEWLASLPLVWSGMLGGRSVLAVHGSPWDPLEEYLYADSPRLAELHTFHYDWVCFGQTHRPLLRPGTPGLLNPGSVGQSRHRPAAACAAMLDTETNLATLEELDYESDPVVSLALAQGAGAAWIRKHLK